MFSAFFALAAVSPGRQRALRRAILAHILVLCAGAFVMRTKDSATAAQILGQLALITGIVEGAILIGWRLTQMPKSQALEFLLATPLRPARVFLGEATVGLARLGLVTLSGLPILVILVLSGYLGWIDVPVLLLFPFTWGGITAFSLTTWAYEPLTLRRWGERFMLVGILFYLGIGVLAGERLRDWVAVLPEGAGYWFMYGFWAFHNYNPFAIVQFWSQVDWPSAWERVVTVEGLSLLAMAGLLTRSAWRLQGHFHERHYRPILDPAQVGRKAVSERPLSWWAVKRVSEYAGYVNLYLAGGFGVLYALHTVAEPWWPAWMGHRVFAIFETMGGIPVLTTALVVLAAVPAAYQYGLWDSNNQERCRRLELLMLTSLDATDYWHAATAAAWFRGRGYIMVAMLLWLAGVVSGQLTLLQGLAALAAGAILWSLYFALGFRAFSQGVQANSMGLVLTLGLPLLTAGLYYVHIPWLAEQLPPGSVYNAARDGPTLAWLPGPLLAGALTLIVARIGLARCVDELRHWYDQHHGSKIMD